MNKKKIGGETAAQKGETKIQQSAKGKKFVASEARGCRRSPKAECGFPGKRRKSKAKGKRDNCVVWRVCGKAEGGGDKAEVFLEMEKIKYVEDVTPTSPEVPRSGSSGRRLREREIHAARDHAQFFSWRRKKIENQLRKKNWWCG